MYVKTAWNAFSPYESDYSLVVLDRQRSFQQKWVHSRGKTLDKWSIS